MLDTDYIFDKGSLIIDYFFDIEGTNTFIYSSKQKLLLNKCTEFRFFQDTTFSYAPLSANKDLIDFDCPTAKIYLNDATLHVTSTGLNLVFWVCQSMYIKSYWRGE